MKKAHVMTDMAVEFYKSRKKRSVGSIKLYDVEVDDALSKKLSRPCGRYTTLETRCVIDREEGEYSRLSDALSASLREYCKGCSRVMAVGLGNPDLTADALGDRVFKRLNVTRHICSDKYLCAFTPNVLGMTGIESFDIISSVADRIKPDVIVAVDALTAAAVSRIATAFQITDSGITPGSGVENHRPRLDRSSLGVKVVSVGVPLVVYSSTIARECCGEASGFDDMIVTPKDVDLLVDDCAKIIADAINNAFV